MMAELDRRHDDAEVTPVVKIKLPWTFLASSAGALAIVLIGMWTSVTRLTDEMREVKTAVQTGNAIVTRLQVEVGVVAAQATETQRRFDRHVENPPRREN